MSHTLHLHIAVVIYSEVGATLNCCHPYTLARGNLKRRGRLTWLTVDVDGLARPCLIHCLVQWAKHCLKPCKSALNTGSVANDVGESSGRTSCQSLVGQRKVTCHRGPGLLSMHRAPAD